MGFYTTDSMTTGAFASFDIDVKKEDKLYRTQLYYSMKDMIDSYNYFITNNIPNILRGTHLTTKGNIIKVLDVEITYPQIHTEDGIFWNTPFIARMTRSSYMADIRIIYTEQKNVDNTSISNNQYNMGNVTSEIKTKRIGSLHILVGSNRCITTFKPVEYGSLDDWKVVLSECPASIGCYTINNGAEKTVTMDQKLKTNIFMTFLTNDDYPRIETRITNMYNSMTAIVRMQIGKNFPNVKVILPFLKGSHIPLYLVFHLLHFNFIQRTNESVIFSVGNFGNIIASFAPKNERDRIIAFLTSSRKKFESFFLTLYNGSYYPDSNKIKNYIQAKMKKPVGANAESISEMYTEQSISDVIVKELFVQCKTYKEKLGNLCYMACQTIRCAIGTRTFDSRDDLANQKVDSFIRMEATYCTDQLLNAIKKETEDKGFQYGKNDRKEVIVEARKCTTLNESIGEMCKIANRVNVRTNSVTLRQVSEDQLGFICPVKTPESSLTGLVKQKAAATHISDNREYEINHYLPVEDLFNPYIQYISDKATPEFKYKFCFVSGNNQVLPLFYAKNGENPNKDNIFVSLRILNLFNKLLEQKQVMYYIDDNSIIYVKYSHAFKLNKYVFNTFIGGTLYVDLPESFLDEFSVVCLLNKNPDYKFFSSVQPFSGCEMCISFRYRNDPNNPAFVTIQQQDGSFTYLNVSAFFIDLIQKSKMLGKKDKIIKPEPNKFDANGNKISVNNGWVIETKNPLMNFEYTHWTGLKCFYRVPEEMNEIFKGLLNVLNEYVSYEKTSIYSGFLTFNGTVVLESSKTGFYPRTVWVNGKKTEEYFREKRRSGILPYDSFAYYDEKDDFVGYYDDPGRLMTPMLIVDANGDLIIDKIDGWARFDGYDFEKSKVLITSLYKEGCMEMLDAKEMDSTLVAIDINECRGYNKLRKLLNMIDLDNINSSIYKIKGTDYFKNQDFTSVKINNNHFDVEWSTTKPKEDVYTFTQNGVTYYGSYVIKRKVAKKIKTKLQKLVRPENGVIMDTYHLIYRDPSSRQFFETGDYKFITQDMDPEFDGNNIYMYDMNSGKIVKYEVYRLDFGRKAGEQQDLTECFVDATCAIVSIKTFTRPSLEKNFYYVVDGNIINENQMVDRYFYVETSQKYIIPTEYHFDNQSLTELFDIKIEKVHMPLLKTFVDIIKYKPMNDEDYDPREARLYNAAIRRNIDALNRIPDMNVNSLTLEDQFEILNELKKDINELSIKRQIEVVRRFLNTEFKFTHCMIDPNQAYSFVANYVPRGGNNPGPRWTYQSAMGVQAMGVGNVVHYRRFETSIKRLISPTEHAFETVAELPGNQISMPTTQNFVFLVAANYKGFEDPIIISKSALEKFGRYERKTTIKVVETKNNNFTEILSYPTNKDGDQKTGYIFRHLEKDGLPRLGSVIQLGDCICGVTKVQTNIGINASNNGPRRIDSSITADVGMEGVITAIHIVGSESVTAFRTIIIEISQRRKQQPGDKMAAKPSQKGTIGDIIGGMINDGDPRLKIVDDCLMPYVAAGPNKGLRADVLFNPASFPSRMTCGLVDEILCSKASLFLQEKVDASSFHTLNHDYYRDALWNNPIFDGKFDSNGNTIHLDINGSEILCHGDGELIIDHSTGKPRHFYLGIVAYQFLKHHAVDKRTARGRGGYKPITHQPEEGRHINGGQRMGEMERDALISSGASAVLFDRFMKCSDGYVGVYCFKCKNDSSMSVLKTKTCSICGTVGSLTSVEEPRIYKVLRHQLAAIGMNILQTLKPVDDFDADKLRANRLEAINEN